MVTKKKAWEINRERTRGWQKPTWARRRKMIDVTRIFKGALFWMSRKSYTHSLLAWQLDEEWETWMLPSRQLEGW